MAVNSPPWRLLGIVALLTLGLDQAVKALVLTHIGPADVVEVIPGFFDLVYVRNRGAAFGFLNDPDIAWQFWLFLAATLVAVGAIVALARRAESPLFRVALGLILGGALGNLVDRLRWRSVLDYLDFHVGSWHWPAFNVADVAICVGVGLVCLLTLRHSAEEAA